MIGWTGEVAPKIRRPWERKKVAQSNKTVVGVANGQLDDLSTPEETTKANSTQHDEAAQNLVSLTKADKLRYQQELKSIKEPIGGKTTELVPVWTLDDADGQPKGAFQETVEKQGRFRKYAEQGTLTTDLRLKASALAFASLCSLARNRRERGNQMVERLCYIKSKVRPEDSRAISTWRHQYGPGVLY